MAMNMRQQIGITADDEIKAHPMPNNSESSDHPSRTPRPAVLPLDATTPEVVYFLSGC